MSDCEGWIDSRTRVILRWIQGERRISSALRRANILNYVLADGDDVAFVAVNIRDFIPK